MKATVLLILIAISSYGYGQVSINATGSTPDSKAMLDVSSTSKGILIPRMSTSERDAIISPTTSLILFNTTTNAFNYWNGSSWMAMAAGNIKELSDADN